MFDEEEATYTPDRTEKRILHHITDNVNATPKEIARATGTDEQTAKRLYNRLFAENVCSQFVLPNYALLGYQIMIIQKLSVKSRSLSDIQFITSRIESEWSNCIDCHETFDGKIFVRSVWNNADDFKRARTKLHQKTSMDWLAGEEVDMVPLSIGKSIFKVRSLWQDAKDKETEE